MKFYVKTKLSENISETPEGFLLCRNVPLTHTGSLKYMPGEHPFEDVGEVVMKREPEELFSIATMSSFEGKDLTVQHPEEFVNPDNFQELTNGHLFNLRRSPTKIDVEGEMVEVLLGDFLIKGREAIELVKDGEREVSLGYECMWQLVGKNEGRHSKIVGNHCALVPAGRAGIHCAINDHKKENELMGMKELEEKFKKVFKGKSIDEAIKEKEDKEAADAAEAKKASDAEEAKKAKDAEEAEAKAKKEKESKDEDENSRLDKIEAMLGKLLEMLSSEEESADADEESEEVVADEDEEESEDESEDSNAEGMEGEDSEEEEEDDKKKKKAGDTMSRAEILAPGIKNSKDVMNQALLKAYKTADGKKVIDSLTGGKAPSTLSKEAIKPVFTAAAEMLKTKRVNDFASAKIVTIDSFPALKGTGQKSAADINKQNDEFYNKKK